MIRFELYDRNPRLIRIDGRVELLARKLTSAEVAKRLGAIPERLNAIRLAHLGDPPLVMYANTDAFSHGLETNLVGTALADASAARGEERQVYGTVLIQPE